MQLKCSSSINVLTRAVCCHHDRYWFYRDSPPVLVYYVHVLPSSVQTPYSDKTLVFCIVQIQSHCVVRSSSSFCFPCFKQNPHRLNSVSVLCLNLEKLCDFSLKNKTKKKSLAGGWWYTDLSLCYTTSIQQALRVCGKGWENPLFAKRAKVDLTGWKCGSSGVDMYCLLRQEHCLPIKNYRGQLLNGTYRPSPMWNL